ncbi:hypothetical protein [Mycobacteroides abscessus]|uniref:hypothetical protein n=1 Tax=Mycobacteroides abscessus TaxID=36809 RepID=UPI0005DC1803|nr:hypothetical protein [Mycobacteroides abscessus]CPR69873.1 Uncharacterised protein [Mycobacteroides abscessus]CPU70500.1 Uncharacterised protein [Mycobacteroides abscessus]
MSFWAEFLGLLAGASAKQQLLDRPVGGEDVADFVGGVVAIGVKESVTRDPGTPESRVQSSNRPSAQPRSRSKKKKR